MRTVADDLWSLLSQAGVQRCYGIVGDALNPAVDALSRRDDIEFVHVRHEEWGAFAAVGDSIVSGRPVAVCGTAGPGVTHLLNGLLDALHEQVPIIAIAGDSLTSVIDTQATEEVSPYDLFRTASLYTGRAINVEQATTVFTTAINVALHEHGPTVIALPGDIAGQKSANDDPPTYTLTKTAGPAPAKETLSAVAELVNGAGSVAIFGGDGCRDCAEDVVALATKLKAPVGYSLKGKNWLEAGNPNAVGMSALLGYGGAHTALKDADVVLMLGTDFPFPEFLGMGSAKYVQVDRVASHLGRRVDVAYGVQSDVGEFVRELAPLVADKSDDALLKKTLRITERWEKRLQHFVTGGEKRSPIRPEYLAAMLDKHLSDDAIVTVDTGTPVMWTAHQMKFPGQRMHFGSYSWASMASASPNAFGAWKAAPHRQVVAFCGDGGFSMLALGDLITEVQHKARIVHVIVDNGMLDFVNIEQQEAGMVPWGTDLPNPNFAKIAEAFGAKGIRLEDPAQVEGVIQEALAHTDGPVVIDAVTDRFALSLPAHAPAKTVKGFTLSAFKQALGGHAGDIVHEGLDNIRLL